MFCKLWLLICVACVNKKFGMKLLSGRREITVGLTPHRLEFLPTTKKLLWKHDIIVLEEPPDPLFQEMLTGRIPLDSYVEETEAGFPEYEKEFCKELRKLHQAGRKICQIEPYLERWVLIRSLLDEGVPPSRVKACPELSQVYEMEHETFGKLLDYYAAMQGSFEDLVEKIKIFARSDARRILLRDKMRAREIVSLTKNYPGGAKIYVEAGYIHIKLLYFLACKARGKFRLKAENLLLQALSASGFQGVLPSPGDGLTSYYLFGGKHRDITEDLLAARSIIYIKLIDKDELKPTSQDPFPHLRNEVFWRLFVWELSYEDCKRLDSLIRLLPTLKAREVARKVFKEAYQKASKKFKNLRFDRVARL